ncbi:hypothetical protein H3146_06005 [Streptomyces sp. OF3]|uniref:FtsK domain-containing protein n=1 Tax=Streptomyces alkaliterrae TaxID=2213162 RepID=A0A7W3WID4_9ACTN|nr:hypothetical protein [Streptomyces alkaliterrae]MBB1252921.1 hypothetical protein [Streptomyces alkaliterrae]
MSTDLPTPRPADQPITEDQLDAIDWSRVRNVGDVVHVPASGDLPAGRIEVIDPAEYARLEKRVQAREAGPAMVALSVTGRAVGLTCRGIGTLLDWTATGAGAVAALGWRYVRAHDLADRLGGAADEGSYKKVVALRKKRWRFLAWAAPAGALAVNAAGWAALVWGAGMTAADSMWITPGALTGGLLAACAVYGRYRRQHRVRAGQVIAPQHLTAIEAAAEDDGEPFPIAEAHTPEQAADCLHRALVAEHIPVADVTMARREDWGWALTVRVSEGTPAAITAAAGALETRLDLPTGGVKVQPMQARRACAVVRLVSGDPFASAPDLPHRAPGSLSITDKARVGTSIAGDPLEITLAGVIGLVVAASGGGKTGLLQALAEVTTACRDTITIDLDPHGDGLEDLAPAVRLTGRSQEQIEAVLLWLLMYSKGRARLRKQLGMGRKWKVSPDRPAIVVFIDEFPKLSDLGKRLAFDLALVGRKEGVWALFASQGGTSRYLGEAFAQMLALKIVGPCKVGDTRAVFGDGSTQEGWAPHTLSPATDTDPRDAGHIYAQGIPGVPDEPVEYKVHEIPSKTLAKLAAERADSQLDPDEDSLAAMHKVDLPDYVQPTFDAEGELKKEAPVKLLTWDALLRLCRQDDGDDEGPARATGHVRTDAAAVMREQGTDRMLTADLAEALQSWSDQIYGDLTEDVLRDRLREAGAGAPVPLGREYGNRRGYKLGALTE